LARADLAFSIRYVCNIATFFAFFLLSLITILQDLQVWAEKFLPLHYQKTKTPPSVVISDGVKAIGVTTFDRERTDKQPTVTDVRLSQLTDMYDISKENLYKPFMSLIPIGMLGAYGLSRYEKQTNV
jgi:hypothetical protein